MASIVFSFAGIFFCAHDGAYNTIERQTSIATFLKLVGVDLFMPVILALQNCAPSHVVSCGRNFTHFISHIYYGT
jgi:hypothetical protein